VRRQPWGCARCTPTSYHSQLGPAGQDLQVGTCVLARFVDTPQLLSAKTAINYKQAAVCAQVAELLLVCLIE
jgi:hypothetical protein